MITRKQRIVILYQNDKGWLIEELIKTQDSNSKLLKELRELKIRVRRQLVEIISKELSERR